MCVSVCVSKPFDSVCVCVLCLLLRESETVVIKPVSGLKNRICFCKERGVWGSIVFNIIVLHFPTPCCSLMYRLRDSVFDLIVNREVEHISLSITTFGHQS